MELTDEELDAVAGGFHRREIANVDDTKKSGQIRYKIGQIREDL